MFLACQPQREELNKVPFSQKIVERNFPPSSKLEQSTERNSMLFDSSWYHRKGPLKNAMSILYSPSPFEREENHAAPAREAADDSPSRIFRYASRKTFLSVSSPRFRGVHLGSSLKSRIAFVYCDIMSACTKESPHTSPCQKSARGGLIHRHHHILKRKEKRADDSRSSHQ